jgi:hypothetical protein
LNNQVPGADSAPEDGESASASAVMDLEMLDQMIAGQVSAVWHELQQLRKQVPYATEVELTVRWRGRRD